MRGTLAARAQTGDPWQRARPSADHRPGAWHPGACQRYPWDDPSGDRLRQWLGVDKATFYDESRIAIMPMGLCYPGKGKSGDLPPRPECAPTWHDKVLMLLPNIELTLLIGQYAQAYYLREAAKGSLTETVRSWTDYGPAWLPLPHPSPRNTFWLRKNPWFEQDVIPHLQQRVAPLLG